MLLHAIWHPSSLYLWASGTGASADAPVSAAGQPPPHPTAEGHDGLRALLGDICEDALIASVASAEHLTLFLPSDEIGPLPPGGSTDGSQSGVAVAAPAAYTVPVLRLGPTEAIDLLINLAHPLPSVCGDSVRYWCRLAQFVIDRLSAQQFFPEIAPGQHGQYFAHWRLLVSGERDTTALEQYAAAMPPVCMAIAGVDPESLHPHRLVETFLHATADALIRRDVSVDEFFNRAHEKAAEALSPPEVRWLSALLGENEQVRGDTNELARLAEQVRTWVARLDETKADAAMQLTFELLEPEDDDEHVEEDAVNGQDIAQEALATEQEASAESEDDIAQPDPSSTQEIWRLRFLLESTEEEGETVAAEELWKEQATGILGRTLIARRQKLMTELSRAVEVFPLLRKAIDTGTPAELHLTTLDAHVFIRQWGPLLQEHGFGVRLPDWTVQRDREIGLLLSLNPVDNGYDPDDSPLDTVALTGHGRHGGGVSTGRLGLDQLLDFDWQIAVGDLKLSVEEFRELASRNTPLVKYKGQWIHLETDAARRALKYLDQQSRNRITLAEAFRTAYGVTRGDTGLPVLGLSGVDWIDHLLNQSPGAMEDLDQPEGFQGMLRPYQKRGLQWLAFLDRLGIGACLADDMGLGKTIQLIALLLHERADGAANGVPRSAIPPTLLFAPTSVVGNWVREIQRFAPSLKVLVHHGPDRLQGEALAREAMKYDVVITSYALAHRDVETLAKGVWGRIALDEAQKIKNPSAAGTQAIRAIPAPRRIAMTGTPIENHLSELWSIMDLLNPGLLGTASEFRERFAVPVEKLGDAERARQLRRMIKPFVLRRTKTDPQVAGDLPEKMEQKVYCNLTTEQAAAYERITAEMLTQIDAATGIRRRGLILAALTRLKQVCNHPLLLLKDDGPIDGRSGKVERIIEMLEEVLDSGDAALIFTQYREMGQILQKAIANRLKHESLFLHGGTPAKARDEMIQRFQSGQDSRIFILSLRAGGLGLNLTAANHVFHFDRWWNPAVESQATDRAYRIGQTRKVQVHKFICVGTMEERIDKLLSDKVALADRIVTTGDEWLTNLSTEELRNYLSLTQEAIGDF